VRLVRDGPDALPVQESGESLKDAREESDLVVDGRAADPAGRFALVRAEVLNRMVRAHRSLPAGWRLVLVEGWRPATLQQRYLDDYGAHLGRRYPDTDSDRLVRHARRVVPPPDLAPHVTGGAVDVTLVTATGALAWMGTEINAFPEDCDDACRTDASNISAAALGYRTLLQRAMSRAGFVNDPDKWWHWSFGDRYWAMRVGEPAARYGPLHIE